MLMEHRAENSHGTANVKKSRSLDLQRLYNQKARVSAVRKRDSGNSSSKALKRKLDFEDHNGVRKKNKKEVLLSSLSSGKKTKKITSKLYGGHLSSASTDFGFPESGENQRRNSGGDGLGGISLSLNGNINIPKRPRDLVRRKKVEVDLASKQEGTASNRVSLGEGGAKLTGNAEGTLSQNGDSSGKLAQNGEFEGASSGGGVAKVKRKKNSDDHNENRSNGSDLLRHLERENSHSYVHNGDSLPKKARRNSKKKKETGTSSSVIKENKRTFNEPRGICGDSQDEEENLEANAARMLSSRFDPSCMGFSSGVKSSKSPSANGLSALISSGMDFPSVQHNSSDELDIASSDPEARALRQRDQLKGKGLLRKRRHFYEIVSRDLDSYGVLNRRIKVFWPLDQSWYFGHIIGYDPEKKRHHVKYDDRDEEWIDLQNEKFKLLLLPNEVPEKVGRKRSTYSRKGEHSEPADKEGNINSCMESEPIISWLVNRKSPPVGIRKKQRTLLGSAKSQLPFDSEGKIEPQGSLVGSSGQDADDLVCSSTLLDNSGDSVRDTKPLAQKSNNNMSPIVYYRRRFHRRERQPTDIIGKNLCQLFEKPPLAGIAPEFVDSVDLDADILLSVGDPTKRLSPDELIWDIDGSGLLKLIIPVTSLKVFRFALSFLSPVVASNIFGCYSSMFTLQHGTLISVWPLVHLEILFVDNVVGLWFLLFEGCLKQAVSFVFLVIAAFCQSNQKEKYVNQQLPVTSIRFRFSGFQDFGKQLVFTFYNFNEMGNSKWSYLDSKLKKHCLLAKQLPPAECTYDNIKALRNGCNKLMLTCASRKSSSITSLRKISRQHRMSISSRQSACVKLNGLTCDGDKKIERLPPFVLSFAAAPTFFLSLHLKLLMERSIPPSSFGEQDPIYLIDHSGNDGGLLGVDRFVAGDNSMRSSLSAGGNSGVLPSGRSELDSCSNPDLEINAFSPNLANGVTTEPSPSHSSRDSPENKVDRVLALEKGKAPLIESEHHLQSAQPLDANNQLLAVDTKVKGGPLNGITNDIRPIVPFERDADANVQNNQRSIVLALDFNNGRHCPNPSQSMWDRSTIGNSSSPASARLSPAWTDGKQDFLRNGFGNGPKRPRTQVSYSLPFGGHDYDSKNKFHHAKGFSHKRIRRTSEKKPSEAFGTLQRNVELLSCDANLLVTVGDRGWRECGARVVLELFDHNEWRLAVKISGDTKYSYKAHQFLQPGTANRYTHAMMWKGGKDWILEFPDRCQWTTFKEMHEECYNRNYRASSVKHIPIPGVYLVEENDDNVPEVPYLRPSLKYYRQTETDIDIALDPSRVLYDMDSDDERWIIEYRALDFNQGGCGDVSDEMFEKIIDVFEKFAYAKQRDHFSSDELEEAMAGLGPFEAITIIYEHWREKRQRKGMPLIRHLQPPLWEKYQQQMKEWEQAITKNNSALSTGCQEKPLIIEKPPMFAFCLKPRGLEVPNRGSKQRSQKKLPVGALCNGVSGDSDAFHTLVGRRLNGLALGDDRVVYAAYNQGMSDSSPVLQGSTRVFSPRDAGGLGYFSLSSDGFERNHYPKLYRNKSRKLCFIAPSNDQPSFASYSQRTAGKRSAVHLFNTSSSEWPSQLHHQPDRFQRHSFEQLDPSELDEFRLRDAASAARHAVTVAKMKRENAQRMLCRADLAMHKAVAAIMTAEAIKASYKEPNNDSQMTG